MHGRRSRLLATATATVAATAGLALASVNTTPTLQSNKAAASAAAAHDLTLTPLPNGAASAGTDPSDGGILATNGAGVPAGANIADAHGFWTAPGDPASVAAWIAAHKPAGATLQGTGESAQHGTTTEWSVMFSFPVQAGVLQFNYLDVSVAAARTGSAIRTDGVASWTVPRPASELIPPGTKSVMVYVGRAYTSKPSYLASTLTAPSEVARLVTLIDSLQSTQPGVAHSCPAILPQTPAIDLRFYGSNPPNPSPGSSPLARVVEDDCGDLLFFINGKQQTSLQESTNLSSVLWSMHALPTCTASQLRPGASLAKQYPQSPVIAAQLSFTNVTSQSVCGVEGYTRLQLEQADGKPLPTHIARQAGARYLTLLMPTARAQIDLSWQRPTPACVHPAAAEIAVRLGGMSTNYMIPVGAAAQPIDPCNGRLAVSSLLFQ
jgi:hypothetical protein